MWIQNRGLQQYCNPCEKAKTERKQKLLESFEEEEDQVDDSFIDKPKIPRPERKRKLLESFEEEDQLDDSVVDKNYIPTNKDDDISDDDEEMEDDLEDIQCTQCEFKSFWEDEVKKHMKQNHKLAKKTKLDNVTDNLTKKSSKTIENIIEKTTKKSTKTIENIIEKATKKSTKTCDECGKTFAQNWNLVRHVDEVLLFEGCR
jgi:hypothetical protein